MRRLWKWLMILFSILLLIAGLLTFPLPFPIGLPLLLIGLTLLVRHSPDAKRQLIKLSKRYPQLNRVLERRRQKPFADPVEDQAD